MPLTTQFGHQVYSEIMGILRFNNNYNLTEDEWFYISDAMGKTDTGITYNRLEQHLLDFRRGKK